MASATNVAITTINATTINDTPFLIALGEDGNVYIMNLTAVTNKNLNTGWQQIPPFIYLPDILILW